LTEIEPCFYCNSDHLIINRRHSKIRIFSQLYCPNCGYKGDEKFSEKQSIEQHNFIAKAVKTLKNIEEKNLAVISQETLNYLNERNWLKTNTSLSWKKPMKSIFDMTDQELEELTDNRIVSTEVIKSVSDMLNIISKTTNKDRRSIDILVCESIKKTVDHQLAYLEQKEKKVEEAQEFKVGWVYEDGGGTQWLILGKYKSNLMAVIIPVSSCDINIRFKFSLDGSADYMKHYSEKKNLIHSTGKKWEPEE